MSVKVMSMVFDRYPEGGGEMLLALALADHASDDGKNVFPSIKALSEKTRQSERSVQYQLRKMELAGWLVLVNSGNGGRNQRREYVISPDWLKGAEIAPLEKVAIDSAKGAKTAPFEVLKGAIHDTKGCNPRQERVQPVAPAYNHQGIISEPSEEKAAHAQAHAPSLLVAGLPADLLADFQKVRKAKRAGPLTDTALKGIQREADAAGITLAQAVTVCCELGWQSFNATWYADRTQSATRAKTAGQSGETAYQRNKRLLYEAATGRRTTEPGAVGFDNRTVIDVTPTTSQGVLQ